MKLKVMTVLPGFPGKAVNVDGKKVWGNGVYFRAFNGTATTANVYYPNITEKPTNNYTTTTVGKVVLTL